MTWVVHDSSIGLYFTIGGDKKNPPRYITDQSSGQLTTFSQQQMIVQ